MLDTCKQTLASQFDASLCMLNGCVDHCPDGLWDAPVVNLKFCQVVFHTLMFADYYLGPSVEAMKAQPFHVERVEFFRDYEELEPRAQVLLYDRLGVREYLDHCLQKAARVVAESSAAHLASPCGVRGWTFSWAELHVRNIRHIQYHAAQLGLFLRMRTGEVVEWVGSGWR